jgi:hypothetical protein
MPHGWIANGTLRQFSGGVGVVGREIAALKCYLAIASFRDFRHAETVLSLYDLAQLIGASRPTVAEGIVLLEAHGLLAIQTRAERNTNVYVLGNTDAGFRKVPQDLIAQQLREIGNRGAITLDALKLYIALLYRRDEADNRAKVTHRTLVSDTGVRPECIAAGNSILHSHRFVTVRKDESTYSMSNHPTNAYILHGDFAGMARMVPRPCEVRSRSRRAMAQVPF